MTHSGSAASVRSGGTAAVTRLFARPVVRGLQFGVGLILVKTAWLLGKPAIGAGVSVGILSTRAESARIKVNGSLPRVICARALAPLDRLLELAAPLSPPGTTGLYLKGKTAAQELRAAEKMWNFDVELVPSVTDRDGRIAVITCLERKAKD